jgi:hypothetical protein
VADKLFSTSVSYFDEDISYTIFNSFFLNLFYLYHISTVKSEPSLSNNEISKNERYKKNINTSISNNLEKCNNFNEENSYLILPNRIYLGSCFLSLESGGF